MIITNYSDLLSKLLMVTDQVSKLNVDAFNEYKKLQTKGRTKSKFHLRKIFHENNQHIYIYRWNNYFAIEVDDCWTLYELNQMPQLCLELK
jgi:hypothetical protein